MHADGLPGWKNMGRAIDDSRDFFLPRPLKRDSIALRQDSGWTRKRSQPGVVELSSRNGHHERLIAHLKRRSGANPSHHVPGPRFWPTRAKRRADKVRGMLPPGIRVHTQNRSCHMLCSRRAAVTRLCWADAVRCVPQAEAKPAASLWQVVGSMQAFVVPIEMDEVSMMARQAVH
jgi:hypothetical protein